MGKVIDFASGGKRNHFNKYKLWDVYKFTEDTIPSDCESHGRVIDITEEYVTFGFRKISNRRLKIVHLHPKDIQAKKVIDLYTQIRQRIFLLLEHPDCIQSIEAGLESILKMPDVTCEEVAFVDNTEFFYKEYLPQVERSRFTIIE